MRGNVLPVPTVRIAQQSILLRHPPINADITHPDQKAGPRDTSTAFTYTPGRCVDVRTYPGTWPEHGCLPRQDARARPVGSLSSFLVFRVRKKKYCRLKLKPHDLKLDLVQTV